MAHRSARGFFDEMPVKGVELEVTGGITEHSSRVALKGVFQNFGDVVACWVPPIDRRHVDKASVRFGNASSAEAAKSACDAGQVFLQGLPVKVDYRLGGGRRVGNSDLGESGGNNDDNKARSILDAGSRRRSRSRRRRSRSRQGRRSRSRDRRRSRSRDRRRDRSKSPTHRFGEMPALPTTVTQPHSLSNLPGQDSVSALGIPSLPGMSAVGTMAAQGGFPGFANSSGIPQIAGGLPDAASIAAAAVAASLPPTFDPEVEAKKKAQIAVAKAERAKQLKRGPGVAALVQGALKRALTQPIVKKVESEKEKAQPDAISDEESEETINRKREEEAREAARLKKEQEEKEAAEREKAEREAREKREQARREALEAELAEQAAQRREAETREQRIRASVETAKKQQAERTALNAGVDIESLYSNMPNPNLEDILGLQAASDAALQREQDNKNMPVMQPEDRSKVLFLDVDGVLRPARAGGFDTCEEGDGAKNVDTSDFFPSAVKALRHIIDRTSAKIVLSSEWRRSDALCNALSEVFEKNRVRAWSSKTPVPDAADFQDTPGGDPVRLFAERRAKEISCWLQEHEREVSGWVVLDDINLGVADESRKQATKGMQPHLVQTWPLCGLTMGNAKTAVRILNGEMINKVVVERPVAPVGTAKK